MRVDNTVVERVVVRSEMSTVRSLTLAEEVTEEPSRKTTMSTTTTTDELVTLLVRHLHGVLAFSLTACHSILHVSKRTLPYSPRIEDEQPRMHFRISSIMSIPTSTFCLDLLSALTLEPAVPA
jgi:hypothetical protein